MTGLTGRYGCVSTGETIPDLAIDWATKSVFNHAFIILDDRGLLVEATPHGVRFGGLAEYAKHPMVVNTGETLTDAQCAQVAQTARGYVGRKYGWADIARLALARFGIHSSLLDRHVSNGLTVICSELVGEVGHSAGLDWSCGKKNLADVTPALLAARPGMEPYIV